MMECSENEKYFVRELLKSLGEDVNREGLLDTPQRVASALKEMTEGMHQDPKKILTTSFNVKYNEMVVVRNIPYCSMCEHHVMPFWGTVTIGYLPREGKVAGLSKFPRLVNCFAHRLQVQEQMTVQIADAIQDILNPLGCGVFVQGQHSCAMFRGVRTHDMEMRTTALRGNFLDRPEVRSEFLWNVGDRP